jgi:tRNA(fMet)-specific endonuclease VapC
MNFFLDTSICVDVLRTHSPQKSLDLFNSFANKNVGYISVITIAELSAGASLSQRRDAMEKTEELLDHVRIVNLTETIAKEGGKLFASLSKSGRMIEFNDCLIASTAKSLGFNKVVTRNCDHFNSIDGVSAILPEQLAL